MPTTDRFLHLYLRDHLAGATGAAALARRVAAAHETDVHAAALSSVADGVAQDRAALLDVMAALRVRPDPLKNLAATVGERLGRLLPNGRLVRRSPLSTVLEIEGLALVLHLARESWTGLRLLAGDDPRLDTDRIDALVAGVDSRLDTVERIRLQLVPELLTG